jgi:conjugative element/phage-associated large polyvalent protein
MSAQLKYVPDHVKAAKLIRQELKKDFPKTKFSVTSNAYSMGNSIRISWINGPTTDYVNSITKKYQYGHFDGMTDCYEYSNTRKDIPQAKFVQTSREITNDVMVSAFHLAKSYFASFDECLNLESRVNDGKAEYLTARQFLNRYVWNTDLTNELLTIEKLFKKVN